MLPKPTDEGFFYLASPYTHDNPIIVNQRVWQVHQAMGWLMSKRYHVYSPIWAAHQACKDYKLPTDHEWWWQSNRVFMSASLGMILLTIDGWGESKGVEAERTYYYLNDKPVYLLDPRDVPTLS